MYLVDSHCHIDGTDFDADRDEVICRALSEGIVAFLNVGTGGPKSNSFEKTVALAQSNDSIFAALGVHPHDAKDYSLEFERRLIDLASRCEKVIAWGEIGLDFYYNHSPKPTQKEVFKRQIEIANQLRLPIIVHSREADEETLEILLEAASNEDFCGGIMHCFGGTAYMAKVLVENGFLISFAGNVTFKKAEKLREAASVVPLDKLLVETDSPFLAPVPVRGRRCEPAFVVHTARFLADLHNIPFETFAKRTTQNFIQFFLQKGRATLHLTRLLKKFADE
ncbi:MAG: TatD family deoxyribonuclease [Acidobacteria bacterium]|nr:MAG: TatD family deoxyribonuclease [Acidobacteriota bacterium]